MDKYGLWGNFLNGISATRVTTAFTPSSLNKKPPRHSCQGGIRGAHTQTVNALLLGTVVFEPKATAIGKRSAMHEGLLKQLSVDVLVILRTKLHPGLGVVQQKSQQ